MCIDLNGFLRTCTLPIGALIVLEIFWNLIGYSVDSLRWLLKFLILAWAGYRYYQGTLGRTSAHSGTGRRLRVSLGNPKDDDEGVTYST